MFEVGDVVVCVDVSPRSWHIAANVRDIQRLRLRAFYTVFAVFPGRQVALTIDLKELPAIARGWDATRFRKLPKADAGFTEQMRALRPHKTPVTASEANRLMMTDIVEQG